MLASVARLVRRRPKTPGAPSPDSQQSWHSVLLQSVLALLFLSFIGCAVINNFVFTPRKGITATPAQKSIPFQEVWFPSADGVRLNGWYLAGLPRFPLVLFFHGNAGNLSDNLEYLNLLHGRGFPVFIFDYRGYGKSAGEPRGENDLYQDARGAVAYLEGRGWRRDGMIFFGQSLGAAVALQSALDAPPLGLVMESSFTSMKEIAWHISPLGYYTIGWWGIDMAFDNLAKIAGVGVPLLLIHGEKDEIAPMEMTLRLFARARQPKMLHIIRGGGHCNVFTLDSLSYLDAWGRYLDGLPVRTANREGVTP